MSKYATIANQLCTMTYQESEQVKEDSGNTIATLERVMQECLQIQQNTIDITDGQGRLLEQQEEHESVEQEIQKLYQEIEAEINTRQDLSFEINELQVQHESR